MMRCALALVCVARVAGQFVVELNDANFDTVASRDGTSLLCVPRLCVSPRLIGAPLFLRQVVDGSRHVLVEFFKPDCGHQRPTTVAICNSVGV